MSVLLLKLRRNTIRFGQNEWCNHCTAFRLFLSVFGQHTYVCHNNEVSRSLELFRLWFWTCLSTWKVHLPNEIQKHSLFNGSSKTDCSFESSKNWGVFDSQNSFLTGPRRKRPPIRSITSTLPNLTKNIDKKREESERKSPTQIRKPGR